MLNILEYSSARARMSVIARGPDGGIHVFTKGADARVGVTHNSAQQMNLDCIPLRSLRREMAQQHCTWCAAAERQP